MLNFSLSFLIKVFSNWTARLPNNRINAFFHIQIDSKFFSFLYIFAFFLYYRFAYFFSFIFYTYLLNFFFAFFLFFYYYLLLFLLLNLRFYYYFLLKFLFIKKHKKYKHDQLRQLYFYKLFQLLLL